MVATRVQLRSNAAANVSVVIAAVRQSLIKHCLAFAHNDASTAVVGVIAH